MFLVCFVLLCIEVCVCKYFKNSSMFVYVRLHSCSRLLFRMQNTLSDVKKENY